MTPQAKQNTNNFFAAANVQKQGKGKNRIKKKSLLMGFIHELEKQI